MKKLLLIMLCSIGTWASAQNYSQIGQNVSVLQNYFNKSNVRLAEDWNEKYGLNIKIYEERGKFAVYKTWVDTDDDGTITAITRDTYFHANIRGKKPRTIGQLIVGTGKVSEVFRWFKKFFGDDANITYNGKDENSHNYTFKGGNLDLGYGYGYYHPVDIQLLGGAKPNSKNTKRGHDMRVIYRSIK